MALGIEGISLEAISEEFDTPFYIYEADRIREQYRKLHQAFEEHTDDFSVNYAVKANPNPSIVSILAEEGAGLDCASRAEMELALQNVGAEDIIFTAPFPPVEELNFAADNGITVNFNSIRDFERAEKLPERVSFRIDPGIGGGDFGLDFGGGSKFGVEEENAVEAYRRASESGVERFGIHMMTGSGILDPEYFERVTQKLGEIAQEISDELGVEFEFIDVGGGLGVPYEPDQEAIDIDAAAEGVLSALEEYDIGEPEVMMEPGRFLVAESGSLITRVNGVMEKEKTYIGLDSGMHHFLRPMLYDAYHEIEAVEKNEEKVKADIVGLVCENTDRFAEDHEISKVEGGDLVAIRDVGAYGFAMASNWNTRPLPPELMIEGGEIEAVRESQSWRDVFHGTRFD